MSSNSSQNIQVTIELGHQASFKKKPSPEGYTHDWSVFVRGPEGSKIQHYVEKVVFQLHESFAKPKRVVKEPPYQVSESGYAGFNFPIVIYFRNKEIPKKISFDYDLFLNAQDCPPINNVRYEKLTFKNPNEEFRQKLLKAGGQSMGNPLALMDPTSGPVIKGESVKKPPKTTSGSTKDGLGSSFKEKSSKHKLNSLSSSSNSSKPSTPQSTPVASKEIRSVTPTTTTLSAPKDHKSRGKEAQKRPSTSSPPDGEQSGKKLKRSSSISSDLEKEKHSHKDKEKSKRSKESKDSKKKSKHQSKSDKHEKKKDKVKHSTSSSEKKDKNKNSDSKSSSHSSKKLSESLALHADITMKTALLSPLKDSSDEDDYEKNVKKEKEDSESVFSLSSDMSSSSSIISMSPLPELSEADRKKKQSKFDVLMAELGDSDSSDNDFNVIIPIIPPSPPQTKSVIEIKSTVPVENKMPKKSKSSSSSQPKKSSSKLEKSKSKETKIKKESKSLKVPKTSTSKESSENNQNGIKEESKNDAVAMNGETISSLWELHDRIMASRDSDMLDEVVGLIQETGLFKVTDTTFDFDLCSLDKETVQKIVKCVASLS